MLARAGRDVIWTRQKKPPGGGYGRHLLLERPEVLLCIFDAGRRPVQVNEVLSSLKTPSALLCLEQQQDLPLGITTYSLDVAVAGADEAGVDVCPARCFSASAAR